MQSLFVDAVQIARDPFQVNRDPFSWSPLLFHRASRQREGIRFGRSNSSIDNPTVRSRDRPREG
eukprot:4221633-Pyramimonas_sp.AAC.1